MCRPNCYNVEDTKLLESSSNILYVRAALGPLAKSLIAAGGVINYLRQYVTFNELMVPHFYSVRPFWRKRSQVWPPKTNSGALGRQIAAMPQAALSRHPTHAFAGFGDRVSSVLSVHDSSQSCFEPIGVLADQYDFSMLLLGCVSESPGFSTVHVAQYRLGLSQRHLLRLMLRWDSAVEGRILSRVARELPGCSASFGKFYPHYEADRNLLCGKWDGVHWLFVPSGRRALQTELALLRIRGRFVDCGRPICMSCRLRLY